MLGGAIGAEGEGAVVGCGPVGSGGVAPEAGAVGLDGGAVIAGLVQSAHAGEETQVAELVVDEDQAVLCVDV